MNQKFKALLPLTIPVLLISMFNIPQIFAYSETNQTEEAIKANNFAHDQLISNIHNYVKVNKMNLEVQSMMLKNIEKQRNFTQEFWKSYQYSNVSATLDLILAKPIELKQIESHDIHKRQWYIDLTDHIRAEILHKVSQYMQNGKNLKPAFLSCESWHKCTNTNSTKFQP